MRTQTSTLGVLFLLALTLLLALPATAQGTRVYKWQDEHGNVHYSDRLPSSHLASNRQELNRDGLRIRQLDSPEITPEAAAERQELLRRAQRDLALSVSFENETELRRVHEERLGLLRSGLALARSNADRLTVALAEQEAHVAGHNEGRPVPLAIQERMEHTRRMLAEQNEEVNRLEQRYDNLLMQQSLELRRYREMAGP